MVCGAYRVVSNSCILHHLFIQNLFLTVLTTDPLLIIHLFFGSVDVDCVQFWSPKLFLEIWSLSIFLLPTTLKLLFSVQIFED